MITILIISLVFISLSLSCAWAESVHGKVVVVTDADERSDCHSRL